MSQPQGYCGCVAKVSTTQTVCFSCISWWQGFTLDIAWQSVLYGLYSTEPEGYSTEEKHDCHAVG